MGEGVLHDRDGREKAPCTDGSVPPAEKGGGKKAMNERMKKDIWLTIMTAAIVTTFVILSFLVLTG
jgi:hypothetical protein